ncbi:MAG TPA: hypothetical protein VF808_14425 [Ktedonobacterales bacterium]
MALSDLWRKTPDTPAPTLTPKERDERDQKAAKAEALVLARHERAILEDLEARARATVQPLALETARASLLAALDGAVQQGATALRAQLHEAELAYASDALIVDYQRQVDGLRRALTSFRPTPALSAKDCDKLTNALRAEVDAIVTALVAQAEDDRTNATGRARRWLTEWARRARQVPEDEAAADRRDNAAFAAALADESPDDDVTVEPVLEVEEGAHTRMYTMRIPIPREGDY